MGFEVGVASSTTTELWVGFEVGVASSTTTALWVTYHALKLYRDKDYMIFDLENDYLLVTRNIKEKDGGRDPILSFWKQFVSSPNVIDTTTHTIKHANRGY